MQIEKIMGYIVNWENLSPKMDFVSQTMPYETWGFKTTFLSLRDKTLIWAFCLGELGHHPVEC